MYSLIARLLMPVTEAVDAAKPFSFSQPFSNVPSGFLVGTWFPLGSCSFNDSHRICRFLSAFAFSAAVSSAGLVAKYKFVLWQLHRLARL